MSIKWGCDDSYNKKPFAFIWVLLALLLAYSILQNFIPTTSANTKPIYIEHVVSGGETLWSIATSYRPDADPREIIWEIQEASDCTAVIRAGQVVLVPVRP